MKDFALHSIPSGLQWINTMVISTYMFVMSRYIACDARVHKYESYIHTGSSYLVI